MRIHIILEKPTTASFVARWQKTSKKDWPVLKAVLHSIALSQPLSEKMNRADAIRTNCSFVRRSLLTTHIPRHRETQVRNQSHTASSRSFNCHVSAAAERAKTRHRMLNRQHRWCMGSPARSPLCCTYSRRRLPYALPCGCTGQRGTRSPQ